jgi:glycosyltransferase involved in cell wall biosynthesis
MSTANVLVESGFDVTVLTAEVSAYAGLTAIDDTLDRGVDRRVRVRRIPFYDPLADQDIRSWPRARAIAPNEWREAYQQRLEFPEAHFGQWKPTLLKAAQAIHRERPVDLVIGSANPHVDLSVGPYLHDRYGIPHVVDHRDSWRLDWYSGREAHVDNPRVAETETEIVRTAHEVWFVNEPIAAWHRAIYPEHATKIRVVPNGYDAKYAPEPVLVPPSPQQPLTFTYVGALSPVVPVVEFLEGWIMARETTPELGGAVARIYGPLRPNDRLTPQLLAGAADYGVQYFGAARKEDLAEIYRSSDVLMLLLAGGAYVTSGKVFEYAASALPIVSVHEPESDASRVLRGYPLWIRPDGLAADQVAEALVAAGRIARASGEQIRRDAAEFATSLERHAQLRIPIQELRHFVTARISAA